jgi:hypothetical protein
MSNYGEFDAFEVPSIGRNPSESLPNKVETFVELTPETLNLEQELLEQYNRARRLLHTAATDDAIPLAQKASALNSATAIISALTKTQADLYSLERVKKIEAVLIATLKQFPQLQEEFLEAYTKALAQ